MTSPQFAHIQVRSEHGEPQWCLAERVDGGWTSGTQRHHDDDVWDVRPLYLVPTDPAAPIRDGIPATDEILRAAKLLQIPVNVDGMGLALMKPERQVTCLLAVLGAWITAYQFVQDVTTDRLTREEMHMLVSSATAETTGDDPAGPLNAAIWHIQWAGFINAETGRGGTHNASSPVTAVESLLRAAALILTTWRDATAGPHGINLDGVTYSHADGSLVQHARAEAVAALEAINKLLPPDRL